MTKSSSRVTRFTLVAAVAALTVVAAASTVFAAKTHEAKPFRAAITGTTTSTGTSDPETVDSSSTGTIQGTHVGNGTYTIEATQDYARHEEAEHPAGDCAFVDGEIEITAANGDTIVGNIDADRSVTCVSVEGPGPGPDTEYLSTLYIDITGGTGRFSDASGWLFSRGTSTFTAISPPASAVFSDNGVILGDIDY